MSQNSTRNKNLIENGNEDIFLKNHNWIGQDHIEVSKVAMLSRDVVVDLSLQSAEV